LGVRLTTCENKFVENLLEEAKAHLEGLVLLLLMMMKNMFHRH
jgi:hypothetical protein